MVSMSTNGGSTSELWIALPRPKYRGPIDSLVVTKTGLKRISEIDPELIEYADQRKEWIVPLLVKITVPAPVGEELKHGITQTNRHWSNTKANRGYLSPANRPPMPAELVEARIDEARKNTFRSAAL